MELLKNFIYIKGKCEDKIAENKGKVEQLRGTMAKCCDYLNSDDHKMVLNSEETKLNLAFKLLLFMMKKYDKKQEKMFKDASEKIALAKYFKIPNGHLK